MTVWASVFTNKAYAPRYQFGCTTTFSTHFVIVNESIALRGIRKQLVCSVFSFRATCLTIGAFVNHMIPNCVSLQSSDMTDSRLYAWRNILYFLSTCVHVVCATLSCVFFHSLWHRNTTHKKGVNASEMSVLWLVIIL